MYNIKPVEHNGTISSFALCKREGESNSHISSHRTFLEAQKALKVLKPDHKIPKWCQDEEIHMTRPIGYIINHELFVEYNPDTADRASRRPSYVPVNSVNDPILEQYKVIRRREHAGGYELERINFRAQCSIDTCQNCGSSRNHRSMRKYETQGDVEVLIKCSDCVVQGFHITFNKGGWGFLPVADGVELCESFPSKNERSQVAKQEQRQK